MNGITNLSAMFLNSIERIHAVSGIVTLTLAHFIWQGFAVAILFLLVNFVLRTKSANARYIAAVVTLSGMMACPIVTLALSSKSRLPTDATHIELEPKSQVRLLTSPSGEPSSARFDVAQLRAIPCSAAGTLTSRKTLKWTDLSSLIVATCYALGVAIMILRLARGVGQARRYRCLTEPLVGQTIHGRLAERCRVWSMRRVPLIACCQRVAVPVVVGVVRPMILVPPAVLTGFTTDQIESMLIHELAHIRRHDPLIHFLQRIVESMLFFHPAVWYVSRRMTIEREIACDDFVIASGWSANDYASTLLALADRSVDGMAEWKATLLAASGDRPSQFKLRILRLLGEEPRNLPFDFNRKEWAVVLLLLASASTIFVGRPLAQAQSPTAPNAVSTSGREDSQANVVPPKPQESIRLRAPIAWGIEIDFAVPEHSFWKTVFNHLAQSLAASDAQLKSIDGELPATENTQENHYLFSAVLIEGTSTLPVHEVEKHITVRANQNVTQSQIKDDVDELVRTRWFASVEPTIRQSPEGDVLVFRLLERPIVRRVEYKGLKKIKQKVFDNLTQLKPGSPFDVAANRECARRIEEYYHDKGFAFATVELEQGNERDDREVVFLIHEGPKVKVSSVNFDGDEIVLDEIAKAKARTKRQSLWTSARNYDPSAIKHEIEGIRRYFHMLGFFDVAVKEHLKFSEDKSRAEIHYEILEGSDTQFAISSLWAMKC